MAKIIHAADLFCGAGGTTTGLHIAAEAMGLNLRLTAVNHWERAIETHAHNHPWAHHFCTGLDALKPSKAVPGRKLDMLIASPECTHHSVARGGKPCDDQSRSSAWHILHWCQELYVRNVLIENVPEFTGWGPLGANGRPLKSKKGLTFQAFLTSLQSLGYSLDWKIVNCADHGDATTRQRFFLLARRGNRRVRFPDQTHAARAATDMFGGSVQPWKPARDIIDWEIPGHSIFLEPEDVKKAGLNIKRPLAKNTIKRIEAGIRKFWGDWAEPFLVLLRGTKEGQLRYTVQSVDAPVPTVTTSGAHVGLCQPFMVRYNGNHIGKNDGDRRFQACEDPISTLDTSNRFGVVSPFIIPQHSGGSPRSVADPMSTICTESRGISLLQPFIASINHGTPDGNHARRTYSPDSPLGTITCSHGLSVISPFIMATGHTSGGHRVRGVDEPISTMVTKDEHYLINPFIIKYYGMGTNAVALDEPLAAVTTDDRFGLVRPQLVRIGDETYLLDILFRMLTPKELAAAHSFPADYHFAGNKSEIVKQIGNSVPVQTANALCSSLLAA